MSEPEVRPNESLPAASPAGGNSDRNDNQIGPASGEDYVQLPSGEALTPLELDEFLRWRPATLVTIVGDRASGKTTLICALYDRFLRGPFAGFQFARSRTLSALEQKSHYGRVESNSPQPDTPRTSISEGLRFFHFGLAPLENAQSRCDLMVADRAGETYKLARNNTRLVDDLVEVRKAERLVLLVDGARVAAAVERAGALQSVRQSLRVFLDNGALDQESVVQVVTTKIDLLSREADADDTVQLSAFKERLRNDFGVQLGSLSFWEISARDPRGVLPPAYGLDALLANWAVPRERTLSYEALSLPLASESDRLLVRTPGKTWS